MSEEAGLSAAHEQRYVVSLLFVLAAPVVFAAGMAVGADAASTVFGEASSGGR